MKQGATVCHDAQKEDDSCSNQFYVDYSIPDHLSYYDIDFSGNILKCQNWWWLEHDIPYNLKFKQSMFSGIMSGPTNMRGLN